MKLQEMIKLKGLNKVAPSVFNRDRSALDRSPFKRGRLANVVHDSAGRQGRAPFDNLPVESRFTPTDARKALGRLRHTKHIKDPSARRTYKRDAIFALRHARAGTDINRMFRDAGHLTPSLPFKRRQQIMAEFEQNRRKGWSQAQKPYKVPGFKHNNPPLDHELSNITAKESNEKVRYVTYKKRPGFIRRHAGKIAAAAIGAGLGAGYVGSMPHDVIKRGRDYAVGAGIGAIGGLGVHKMFESTDEAFANLTEGVGDFIKKKLVLPLIDKYSTPALHAGVTWRGDSPMEPHNAHDQRRVTKLYRKMGGEGFMAPTLIRHKDTAGMVTRNDPGGPQGGIIMAPVKHAQLMGANRHGKPVPIGRQSSGIVHELGHNILQQRGDISHNRFHKYNDAITKKYHKLVFHPLIPDAMEFNKKAVGLQTRLRMRAEGKNNMFVGGNKAGRLAFAKKAMSGQARSSYDILKQLHPEETGKFLGRYKNFRRAWRAKDALAHLKLSNTEEAFANLTESNKVCMDKKDFKKEHVTLLRKLKRGNKRELRDEAQKQGKEMKKELHESTEQAFFNLIEAKKKKAKGISLLKNVPNALKGAAIGAGVGGLAGIARYGNELYNEGYRQNARYGPGHFQDWLWNMAKTNPVAAARYLGAPLCKALFPPLYGAAAAGLVAGQVLDDVVGNKKRKKVVKKLRQSNTDGCFANLIERRKINMQRQLLEAILSEMEPTGLAMMARGALKRKSSIKATRGWIARKIVDERARLKALAGASSTLRKEHSDGLYKVVTRGREELERLRDLRQSNTDECFGNLMEMIRTTGFKTAAMMPARRIGRNIYHPLLMTRVRI